MAWIKVKEQGHLASSDDEGGKKSASRTFVAISDTPTTPVAAETADAGGGDKIPPRTGAEAAHPDDPTRKVKSISAKPHPDSARTVFFVEVKYGSSGGADIPENPLDRDPEISWDFNDYTETFFEDRSEEPKPVVNTAGDPFEEFLERDTGSIVCTVQRNIPATVYDPPIAVAYKDVVNEDAFDIDGVTIGAGQCKMKSYTAGPRQTENGVAFRVARWVLEFRETWDIEIESRGFQEIVPGSDPPKLDDITNNSGKVPPFGYPLDGDGHKFEDPRSRYIQTFKPYYVDEFSGFAAVWAYA